MKLLGIAAACVFFLTYCPAAEQVIELGKVQIANSLSGRVIGPAGEQIPDVQVIEVTADWRTAVRRTVTDALESESASQSPWRTRRDAMLPPGKTNYR